MKNVLFLFIPLLLVSCNKTAKITVTNPLAVERNNEIVEFPLLPVKEKLGLQGDGQFIILDPAGFQVPYQILSDGETVIFQATVSGNSSAKYTVQAGTPENFAPRTFARQVPERLDDFAWENDRIAFRMYGPALKASGQNPSNGVDMWLKRTEDLIIDKWYKNDLAGIASYHVDNGEGLDCYKVARTLGVGGVAPFVDSILWVGGHYSRYEIKESGALRTEFTLYYDEFPIGTADEKCAPTPKQTVQAILTIRLDAGNQLNKASVVYQGENVDRMPVATGLYLHKFQNINDLDIPNTERRTLKTNNMMAMAADAIADDKTPSGRAFMGVIVPTDVEIKENEGVCIPGAHLLAVGTHNAGQPFVYYFGGGWSKFGFETDEDWFEYMESSQAKIQQALQVSVR